MGVGVCTCAAVCCQTMQHSLLVERLLFTIFKFQDFLTMDDDGKETAGCVPSLHIHLCVCVYVIVCL